MKRITLEKIARSLETRPFRSKIDPTLAQRARRAVERMLQVGRQEGKSANTDVLVIGAGVAGMSVVRSLYQQAPQLRVGLVTLLAPGQAGATPWAQGGVAVAWGQDDSPRVAHPGHAGRRAGPRRPEAVEVLTQEGPLFKNCWISARPLTAVPTVSSN